MVFGGGILGSVHKIWGNPYLNSATVLFDVVSKDKTTKNFLMQPISWAIIVYFIAQAFMHTNLVKLWPVLRRPFICLSAGMLATIKIKVFLGQSVH